jgi:beta-N-acetylhexosaminidase
MMFSKKSPTNKILPKRLLPTALRRRAGLSLILLISSLVTSPAAALAAPVAQGADPQAQALALLEKLTPEEKVGQLFLVTFSGSRADNETQIYDLINNYHIGGVVVRRDMDNFVAAPDTLQSAHDLIAQLQSAEADASQASRADVTSGMTYTPSYIPLLIALSQEGDGDPNDQLLDVLSPQPNAMTLGATWNPDLARQAGELLGSELSILGINLLLGPSLDVLQTPQPDSTGDLGVRSFGGDPYWVGQMGQAYITGIHTGSQRRVAVVAKHLPGHGDSDRPLDEEVPTIRKSLAQLTQVELPPFFAVTGEAPSKDATADAMLLAHIRYQGFQGNIRATTRPLSFDPQAFSDLMALPAFAQWRQGGGLIVSDSLGTRAVRRLYDASEQVFDAPLIARDAFLAGNDLLYLGNFVASGDTNSYTTIARTMQFFAQKYREDVAFSERVDESVARILALKFELYPNFSLDSVVPSAGDLASVGKNEELIFDVGRQAATLFSPSPSELVNILPEPPGRFEQIVFITDSYNAQQCSACEPQPALSSNSLAQAVLRLYGPGSGDQITAANISSFSFNQLVRTLDGNIEGEDPLLSSLPRAEWVVFGLGNEDSNRPESLALRRLLSERLDLIQNKKVVVFALNAPYYLDATDITKIDAYYGLYGKSNQIADVAARLLFQEISAPGSSPVSVSGVGYDLIEATSPDPAQNISLQVTRVLPNPSPTPSAVVTTEGTATATETPTFQAGDLLNLQVGPIVDHNGHPVPDNTPVTFSIVLITEQNTLQRQINATTHQGVALASYSIEDEGGLGISASSGEPPALATPLHFEVSGINAEGLALQATQTAQAQLLAVTPVPTAQPSTSASDEAALGRTDLVDWFLVLLISGLMALFAYQTGINLNKVRWAVRWGLTSLIGGLAMGSYIALGFPGSRAILMFGGKWGLVLAVLGGAVLGWAAGLAWREVLKRRGVKPT